MNLNELQRQVELPRTESLSGTRKLGRPAARTPEAERRQAVAREDGLVLPEVVLEIQTRIGIEPPPTSATTAGKPRSR